MKYVQFPNEPYTNYFNKSTERQYYNQLNWFQAQAECNKMDANLARGDSFETLALLADIGVYSYRYV